MPTDTLDNRKQNDRAAAASDSAGATPMMAQFLEIKAAHPDALLFFRSGDFYELFFDDAVKAAAALSITLTRRGKHAGEDVAMCGVPYHAADSYLHTLIKKGFRVAICEQMEDPGVARRRGGKALIRREVVRVVTPGTLTEDALLEAGRHNYLAALADAEGRLGLAWIDMSTGDFRTRPVADDELANVLARLDPGEVVLPERLWSKPALSALFEERDGAATVEPDARFDSTNGRKRIEDRFGVETLDAFGDFSRAEIAAAGALLDYVTLTQQGRDVRLDPPVREHDRSGMAIDAATRRNLEITRSLSGERRGSLLATIDRTRTSAGGRLLAERLAAPLTELDEIGARLDGVALFVDHADLRADLRRRLQGAPDMARALARLSLGRGGPRDLAAIRDGLVVAGEIAGVLHDHAAGAPGLGGEIGRERAALSGQEVLIDLLARALSDKLPLLARDGGFVARGYAPRLDELITLRDESERLVRALQEKYAREAGIPSLKVRHNNVLGYFVEVTSTHGDKLMSRFGQEAGGRFIHRQTLASAVRFTTVELGELEGKIRAAAEKALALELEIFDELVARIVEGGDAIAATAHALAVLDVASALAELAVEAGYTRPEIDDGTDFDIRDGRHPVVERALGGAEGQAFTPNDCGLSADNRLWLVTGPNMAGKSTFLRQNAVIAILAQTGSFVPASSARIGIVDKLFSRVGASDDLARGRSTFMVEMVETALILNQAGPKSLVIFDEMGRGTATFDGLSIAWAAVEHLHDVNRCRALFATHYHELTALQGRLDALSTHTMAVKEWQGDVVFLHEVAPGAADRSYGIHVARLAGLPPAVIERAREVLGRLEAQRERGQTATLADDLPLFQAPGAGRPGATDGGSGGGTDDGELRQRLRTLRVDELSPRAALDLLYELTGLARE